MVVSVIEIAVLSLSRSYCNGDVDLTSNKRNYYCKSATLI